MYRKHSEGVYIVEESRYLGEETYHHGGYNDDFYSGDEIANLLEDDEISSEEEGFMRGYMEL
jgi:hypothetical protein